MNTLCVLCDQGDIRITWDHSDPASVENARKEVMELKAAGYTFFLVDGTPADQVAAGQGALNARRVTAEALLEDVPPIMTEDGGVPVGAPPIMTEEAGSSTPSTRGRRKSTQAETKAAERVAVAVPRQRGG